MSRRLPCREGRHLVDRSWGGLQGLGELGEAGCVLAQFNGADFLAAADGNRSVEFSRAQQQQPLGDTADEVRAADFTVGGEAFDVEGHGALASKKSVHSRYRASVSRRASTQRSADMI